MTRYEQGRSGRPRLLQYPSVDDVHVAAEHGVHSPSTATVRSGPVFQTALRRWWCRREDGRVMQVALGAHDAIGSCGRATRLEILMPQNVAIGKEHRLGWEMVPQVPNHAPIGQPRQMALLLSLPTMHGQDAGARRHHHPCVLERLVLAVEDADLGRDRDVQLRV